LLSLHSAANLTSPDNWVAITNFASLAEWNADGNFEGWTLNNISSGSVAGGVLSGTAATADP
jgi:hypothetical protein